MDLSILILTLNEEKNLPACLDAVSWCDDVVVLDSFSEDKTTEIAESFGARIYQRKFDSFADQRNFALENVSFKHKWVLHLDADEIVTEELRSEIAAIEPDQNLDAYRMPSKMILFEKWLRYSGMYPNYQVRLTRIPNFRFKQVGHGQKEDIDQSRIGVLRRPYLHYSFSKGFEDWFERHNRYSSLEAEEMVRHLEEGRIDWPGLLSSEPFRKRKALKELSYRLPLRPVFRFLYMYFLRLGFLDGYQGFVYSGLLSVYEYMITLKVKEIRRRSLH